MDQQIVPDKQTSPDQKATTDQQLTPKQQTSLEQQIAIEQEPNSDQFELIPPDQITPQANEAFLLQHQRFLRNSYPSCDLSEISYHTEHTGFPGSRHSSLNTEPLTLDADQIHDAKDRAEDVIQRVDTNEALDIFTKDLETNNEEAVSQEPDAQALNDQLNTLVEKAQQVAEVNEQQLGSKTSGKTPGSLKETRGSDELAATLEDDAKLKAD